MSSTDIAQSTEPYYAYRPSLTGAPVELTMHPDSLEWRSGRYTGSFFYRDVRKVRLTYRPVTTESRRFVAEVWSTSGAKAQVVSTSWRGMVQQDRLDAQYTAFVSELHRRIAAAGAQAEFVCGSPALLYWPGVFIFLGLCVGVIGFAFQAAQVEAWTGFAVVGAMMLFFLWQTGNFFRRNLPGVYRPDALPERVMPPVNA